MTSLVILLSFPAASPLHHVPPTTMTTMNSTISSTNQTMTKKTMTMTSQNVPALQTESRLQPPPEGEEEGEGEELRRRKSVGFYSRRRRRLNLSDGFVSSATCRPQSGNI